MSNPHLSKSTFIYGNQCHKRLYLYKFHRELMDKISERQKAIFAQGTDVGELAQGLFPGGVDCSPEDYTKYFDAIKKTAEVIKEGAKVIYEAGFCFNRVISFIDILVKVGDRWNAYEVKSSTGVSDTYKLDASLQYYVMANSGLDITNVFIIHINNQYVRNGDLELKELFHSEPVTEYVLKKQNFVKKKVTELHKVLSGKKVPEKDIGPHCSDPYRCDFKGHCWQHVPQYSVFNIAYFKKSWDLYETGVIDIRDVPDDYSLGQKQRMQVDLEKSQSCYIDKAGIQSFLKEFSDKLYFIDFETYQEAVPSFDNVRPYVQIPFQYSLHYQNGDTLKHKEFLADAHGDPRRPFIENLLEDTKGEKDIIVYTSFECTILKGLSLLYPELADDINNRISRLKDLSWPFSKRLYYTPVMRGLFSIKIVLPALVPELSYEKLEINNGGLVSVAFKNMKSMTNRNEIEKIRQNLLEYCKLDTLAMVKILEKLKEV